jgi:predicted DsbA family dithiol-disulfide isomerase
MVARLLASDADAEEIRTRDAEARKMGIQSVPTFIVAGQHAVPGAQPTALWVEVMGEIMEKLEKES